MLTTSRTVLLFALAGFAGTIIQSRALVLVATCGIPLVLVLHTVRRLRSTADYCLRRIERAREAVAALSGVINAASPRLARSKADRDLALAHINDALHAIENAESAVCGRHYPTHMQGLAEAERRREQRERDLFSRIENLEDALAQAQVHPAVSGDAAPRQHEYHGLALAQQVRRVVMSSVHPDNAADPTERKWRTRLCQDLFPEIDRIMNESKRP
jgi:hypothetical protein